MAAAVHLASARNLTLNPFTPKSTNKSCFVSCSLVKITSLSKRHDRRLIRVSPTEGRWSDKWKSDFLVTLRALKLEDLVQHDQEADAEVSISLSVQKHASFGLSIDGRIITCFSTACGICSSSYSRQIDASFNVWVLQSNNRSHVNQLPEIGGDDPSVIYVKPGDEAYLDSLVQDTIRLTASLKDTCSEICEKSEPTLHYVGDQNAVSFDRRWSRLLELRNPSP